MTEILDPDVVSRSLLALVDDGVFADLRSAEAHLAEFQPTILVGAASCSSYSAQAATLAAVTCAVRAFHGAHVRLDADTNNLWRGSSARTLAAAIVEVGGDLQAPRNGKVAILIGDAKLGSNNFDYVLRVTWEGWKAIVLPGDESERAGEDEGNVLSALAASGLAINEIFSLAKERLLACAKVIQLDLWDLGEGGSATGPRPIAHVPADWWLVGLGHLGQANAWVISWLPRAKDRMVSVTLQDDETIVRANLSTSLCALDSDLGIKKTRAVARVLDRAGYSTRILERRLEPQFEARPDERPVALFGVDNLETRRTSDHHNWPLVVDVGLGSSGADFGAISMHVFPGRVKSQDVAAWEPENNPEERRREQRLAKKGFQALLEQHDVCGVETLAGTNVAASFVGLVAACLAVSEALRTIQGGPIFSSAGLELWDLDPVVDPSPLEHVRINALRC